MSAVFHDQVVSTYHGLVAEEAGVSDGDVTYLRDETGAGVVHFTVLFPPQGDLPDSGLVDCHAAASGSTGKFRPSVVIDPHP